MGALAIRQLRKTFGHTEILKGIDLEIEAGEFLILVGPSGCGKSTLLNMIAGLEQPSSGSIHIGDREVTRLPSKDRDIAMVFQSYALYPNMNVAQNIAFALEMRKVPKAEREAAVQRVAAMLQIEHLLQRRPAQLSGGQRQRVAMGRALARNPRLFLFDEPLSNLDAKLRVEMRAEIKLLHQRTRTTTVYVTHDQVEAMTLGDRIAVMRAGEVQQFGTPQQIYERPANKFVAEFVGSPAMNFFAAPDRPGQEFGVRPEHLLLGAPGDGLPGRVLMLEPTGPETYVKLETPLGTMTARVAGRASQQAGDRVGLSWAAEHAHRFDGDSGRRVEAA
ncbi:ABC transporter ATP-binding protein [Pelomonas sp. CA6]|uniref:ABC transporter ATP-binding protein n=1 Tax=Pelomonas sp. CA6 TaxID=2907999 RepID=UPI001F4C0AC8|nr:ABC transporter ATP-binding protein [Pelomonas sp. CA6]MCH7342961.1 ABC transporter ATP-binding protein [Pelomonas sp. CA6]